MKVKMLRTVGTRDASERELPTDNGKPLQEGKAYDLPESGCQKLIAAKLAEPAGGPEKAPAPQPAK